MEETVDPTVHSNGIPPMPRSDDLTGKTLGDFQLLRRIGQGGMGQVYLARQLSLKRQVAVKILRTDLAANITALQRFQLEAEAVARINHANIVQVFSIGQTEGLNYMALEYVEGRNLRDYLSKKGPPELPITLNIMRQIAAALQRAHELGFVHRDIKPENILLTRKVEVKVADFGLSRCFASDQPLNITQSGVTMGTPLYMSPEQVQGKQVDPRSDLYSFGVTAYHMLAGEPPFTGQTPFDVAIQHVQNEPRSLVTFGIPDDLAAIVHKMMAKKLEDRYQSSREVLRDLTKVREAMAGGTTAAIGSISGVNNALARTSGQMTLVADPAPKARHSIRYILAGLGMLAAASVGAGVHWQTHRPKADAHTEAVVERLPAFEPPSTQVLEKQLRHAIDDKLAKPDVAILALLDLTQLLIRQKRFDEALKLYELSQLQEKPFMKEAQKLAPLGSDRYPYTISKLGTGIVHAYRDQYKESLNDFAAVMPKQVKAAKLPSRNLDQFFRRHQEWAKAVADALDRNAHNLDGKLDEPFARYRSYAKVPNR